MELTTRYAKLPLVFVALNKQATLGVYDTWNGHLPLTWDMMGLLGSFPQP